MYIVVMFQFNILHLTSSFKQIAGHETASACYVISIIEKFIVTAYILFLRLINRKLPIIFQFALIFQI